MGKGHKSRPLLVTLLGILMLLIGLLTLLGAGLTFLGLTLVGGPIVGAATGGGMAILGLLYIIVGIGFLNGWGIMWYIGVIVEVLGILFGLFSLAMGNISAILSILVGLIILLYLFKDNVKSFFIG